MKKFTGTTKGISLITLALLITSAIDSIRNLPASALFGSSLIFFYIFGAIVFLIPVALISAELSSAWTEESGVYSWVKRALGEKTAFLAIWLQWINTIVWYPTILSFIAGTFAFLINPHLVQNKMYLMAIILGTFWLLTLINLKGIQTSAKFAAICTTIGMLIPMILIISLAIFWIALGKPLQIHPTFHTVLPTLGKTESWISLTAIMASFLGMELACVHVKSVNQPQKTFPKALGISVAIILTTMILGSLAIAFVLPHQKINLVDGVMQAFSNFFHVYHITWMIPVITIALLIGSLGGMVNWIISPAKGLLQAAKNNYLPPILKKENKHGVASNLLILQALLVTVICLAFLLMPSVNGSYWLLTDLSTQLYMLMYCIVFVAALVIKYKFEKKERPFKIPGGKFGMWMVCSLGLIGCLMTLVVGFFPPDGINVGGKGHYEILFSGGMIVMILPVIFFYFYHHWQQKLIFSQTIHDSIGKP